MGIKVARSPTFPHTKFKSKKVEAFLLGIHHVGLFLVEYKSQSFEHPAHNRHRLLSSLSAQHDKIVGIPDETCSEPASEAASSAISYPTGADRDWPGAAR